jgi:hypothetical protein
MIDLRHLAWPALLEKSFFYREGAKDAKSGLP